MKHSHLMNKNMHLIYTCVTLVLKLLPLCEDRCINLASSATHWPGIERLNFNNMQELIPALPDQTNIFAECFVLIPLSGRCRQYSALAPITPRPMLCKYQHNDGNSFVSMNHSQLLWRYRQHGFLKAGRGPDFGLGEPGQPTAQRLCWWRGCGRPQPVRTQRK